MMKHAAHFDAAAVAAWPDVYRFARSLAQSAFDADDLVQETYCRAYRARASFDGTRDARPWLFTICRNVFRRGRARDRRIAYIEDADVAARASWEPIEGGWDAEVPPDLAAAVERAVSELPAAFREVVILVAMDGVSYQGAARRLGVPVGTVRSRLCRARRLLQRRLSAFGRDFYGEPNRGADASRTGLSGSTVTVARP